MERKPFSFAWLAPSTLIACACGAYAGDCPDALFTCETNRPGKYAQICATEVTPGQKWDDIYYRFGAEGAEPELVYPAKPGDAKRLFFFSHTVAGTDYRVTVRFNSGGYTYRVYSNSGQGNAGVQVSDKSGKVISNARCIERPHMFPSYLQRALGCDAETPHGVAACGDKPLRVPK